MASIYHANSLMQCQIQTAHMLEEARLSRLMAIPSTAW
jgi:hypothetical protein